MHISKFRDLGNPGEQPFAAAVTADVGFTSRDHVHSKLSEIRETKGHILTILLHKNRVTVRYVITFFN